MHNLPGFLTLGHRASTPASASSISSTSDPTSRSISPALTTGSSQASSDVQPPSPASSSRPRSPVSLVPDQPELGLSFAKSNVLNVPPRNDPPPYLEAPISVKSVTYEFSALPNGAYTLSPSSEAGDDRPVYHIRSSQSIFSPSAHQTVVRRGVEEGEFVGEFEFGMSSNSAYIAVHGKADYLTRVLHKTGKPSGHISRSVEGHWTWTLPTEPPVHLSWDCVDRSTWTCSLLGEHNFLARYRSPGITPYRESSMPTLEVSPKGQKYFDQILIAALIFEQKAALPAFHEPIEYRKYFNF